jgi:hypothetical protein
MNGIIGFMRANVAWIAFQGVLSVQQCGLMDDVGWPDCLLAGDRKQRQRE